MSFVIDKWTDEDYENLIRYLKEIADDKYRDFNKSLVPGNDNMLGIRMPIMRALGKEISKGDTESYYKCCRSDFYEETMLRGIVIGCENPDADRLIELVDGFMPYIHNWAICDCFCAGLKACKKHREEMFDYIDKLLHSDNDWKIRAGLVLMLDHYMLEQYIDEVLSRCDEINSTSYYVYMAQAWLVSICYVNFKEATMAWLKNCRLNDVTFNKAIQKIRESRRVSAEDKKLLNTMKR